MGKLLNTATVMMCPHGGTVSAITSSTSVKAGGSPVVRASDTFSIAGCPFNISGGPHPCLSVKWVMTATRCKNDALLLTTDSIGLCLAGDQAPQGPVQIVNTQPRVSGL